MEDDIVVRLRNIATFKEPITTQVVLRACIKAINEIESLRNQNQQLKEAIRG
jgi:hypothetical protein